jgi:hypothetical protein
VLEGTTVLWCNYHLEFNLKYIYNTTKAVWNSMKTAPQKLVKNNSAVKVSIICAANYFHTHVLHFSLTCPMARRT